MKLRKRTFWLLIVTALIGLPVLYVLSFGPACWWFANKRGMYYAAPQIYWPIGEIAESSDGDAAYRIITWYALLGRTDQCIVTATDSELRVWLPLMRDGLPIHD